MKKLISAAILINIMSLSGCDWFEPEDFPPERDIIHKTIIVNNSTHIIRVDQIWNGEIYPYTLHPNNEKVALNELYGEDLPFFTTLGDSSMVIYDNEISVLHTTEEEQPVSRSIMLESSYTGGKVNDKLYEIYYTFTDADYEEAVELNEGG